MPDYEKRAVDFHHVGSRYVVGLRFLLRAGWGPDCTSVGRRGIRAILPARDNTGRDIIRSREAINDLFGRATNSRRGWPEEAGGLLTTTDTLFQDGVGFFGTWIGNPDRRGHGWGRVLGNDTRSEEQDGYIRRGSLSHELKQVECRLGRLTIPPKYLCSITKVEDLLRNSCLVEQGISGDLFCNRSRDY